MAQPAVELSFVIRDVGLGMTLLESFMNGLYTMIFGVTLYLLVARQREKHYKGGKYMLTIIITLYSLSVVHLGCRWNMIRQAFVVDGDTVDTILQSILRQPTWSIVLSSLSLSLMTLIADCVLVWRCWVVWDRNWRAPLLPLLSTLVGTVFCVFSLIFQIRPESRLFTSERARFVNYGLVYFSLSLATTLLSNGLIIFRIVQISRQTLMTSRYKGVIEIITESAALYAVVMIIFLPFFAQKDFTQGYAQAILVPITGIAPTIITARVSLGLALENKAKPSEIRTEEMSSDMFSTIQVNISHHTAKSFEGSDYV